jgi:hypothetical protein
MLQQWPTVGQQLPSQEFPARVEQQRQQKQKATACRPVLQTQQQQQQQHHRRMTILDLLVHSYKQQ